MGFSAILIHYQLQFRKVDEGRITPWEHQEQSEDDLRRSRPGDPPSIRINGLLPNTVYTARIAIYSNYSLRSFGKTSSTIEFKTEGIVSIYQLYHLLGLRISRTFH